MSASGSSHGCWEWKTVVHSDLLARGFHSCNIIQGKLVIFGGLKSPEAQESPRGDVVTFDPALQAVLTLCPDRGWGRSHHEAVVLANRFLCVVGGWDGSRRVSEVCSFDMEQGQWEGWALGRSEGVPVGLSSHTCTKITDHEARVVGREGGLRTQRRYSSVFTLGLDPATKTYWYKEEGLHTASRAGHSAMLLRDGVKGSGYQLVVFGGRDSADFDVAGRWGKGKIHVDPVQALGLTEQLSCLVSGERGSSQAPKGLRHQSCTVVGPFAVIFGGEALGKGRDAVCNDLYIHDTKSRLLSSWLSRREILDKDELENGNDNNASYKLITSPPLYHHNGSSPAKWFHFPCSDRAQKRVGHRTCLWNDKLYLVGGFGADGKTPRAEISTLEITP